jgi:hypothetical protein
VVVGAMLTFISVAYSSIRTSSNTQLGKLGMTQEGEESVYLMEDGDDMDEDDEERGQRVVDNEVRLLWLPFTTCCFWRPCLPCH